MKVVQWRVSYAQGHARQTTPCVKKMNCSIVDQTLSPKKGEALPKRGDADSADHIVRAYSPIMTASHSIHSLNLITPSPKTCFWKRMHSHHCNSQDPSPLMTIALDHVEKQKTEQTTSELGTTSQSTIPWTCTQAWLNFTRRCCWRFVSVSWCVSRMGIQEGQLRIVCLLLISLVPLMFPRMKNLLRVWGRILFGFLVDTAIFEKTFCNTTTAFGCRDGQVIILDFPPLNLQEAVWFM